MSEVPQPRGQAASQMLATGELEHLHQRREIGLESPNWRLGEQPTDRLWTISLHYHAWAYSLAETAADLSGATEVETRRQAGELFRHYVADWIGRCCLEQPGSTALAWNSYALATRLGWWIRSYRKARDVLFGHHTAFEDLFLRSLWQQAAYLNQHLEWDLRGNHLIRNLSGLALAGRFFDDAKARQWLERAGHLAIRHGVAQILEDGGHYERSPKYHFDVMAAFLELALLVEADEVRNELRKTWSRMAEWAAWMRQPDGSTAQFNDGAVISASAVKDRLRHGRDLDLSFDLQPRKGGKHLKATGMVTWHGDPWTVFFDIGEIAPDEQPGHGHADTLSIECSYEGRRLIVDPGSFDYDSGRRRRYDRSTEAHNTIAIDGLDSSEVWHIFRVGRRARPRDVAVEFCSDGFRATAGHDGYDHLPGKPRHRRTLHLDGARILEIEDEIEGDGAHLLQGGFLIESSWKASPINGGWALAAGGRKIIVHIEGTGDLERFLEERWHHPDYGVERPATRLGWRCRSKLPFKARVTLVGSS